MEDQRLGIYRESMNENPLLMKVCHNVCVKFIYGFLAKIIESSKNVLLQVNLLSDKMSTGSRVLA